MLAVPLATMAGVGLVFLYFFYKKLLCGVRACMNACVRSLCVRLFGKAMPKQTCVHMFD